MAKKPVASVPKELKAVEETAEVKPEVTPEVQPEAVPKVDDRFRFTFIDH
jgi:hypothetical protein